MIYNYLCKCQVFHLRYNLFHYMGNLVQSNIYNFCSHSLHLFLHIHGVLCLIDFLRRIKGVSQIKKKKMRSSEQNKSQNIFYQELHLQQSKNTLKSPRRIHHYSTNYRIDQLALQKIPIAEILSTNEFIEKLPMLKVCT